MRVGVLAGFDEALVDALRREVGNTATWVDLKLGSTAFDADLRVDVILDRASHENPFYAAWVRCAEDRGVRVLNASARNRAGAPFADLMRVRQGGLSVAETVLLPTKEYPAHLGASALTNLAFPLDWDAVWARVAPRARLLPALPMSMLTGVEVRDVQGLLAAYDRSGQTPAMVQRCLDGRRARAFWVRGQAVEVQCFEDDGLPAEEDVGDSPISALVRESVLKVAAILDLDCAALDFTITADGAVLTAVDTAAPEIDPVLLGEERFLRVVKSLAHMLTAAPRVKAPRRKSTAASKRSKGA